MSVRKRKWTTSKGVEKEAWVVAYVDQEKKHHIKTFDKKKDADTYHDTVRGEVRAGRHVAPSKSITVAEAATLWIAAGDAAGLERTTIEQYQAHADRHISPFIGSKRLSEINPASVRAFEDTLRKVGRSPAMIRKTLVSLGSLIANAQEQGLVGHNAVRDLRRGRSRRKDRSVEQRRKGKLKVGINFPTPEEIRALLAHATPRWRPLLVTAVFTGLRASELRGLRWEDLDLKANKLHVRQRADRFNQIGPPKSVASERTVPFGKTVANTLREWRLARRKSEQDLVFPNPNGGPYSLVNVARGLAAAEIAAGLTKAGRAKYPGMHSLRHFYASWCINRPADGGLGLPPKVVQERMGHSQIAMTLDVYGHLFPRGDDAGQLDAAELTLIG